MNIINATFRMRYIPGIWKIADVLMILKPGKPPNKVDSYRPISLLPIMSKLFEKLLLIRLKAVIAKKNLIPDHQFGLRNQHSTLEQVHRIIEAIEQAIEEKIYVLSAAGGRKQPLLSTKNIKLSYTLIFY
jgi:hypothetical protein